MRALRIVLAFIAAVLAAAVLGAAASTQFVLAALAELGARIPFAVRAATTLEDIAGMGPLYAAIIAVGFLIAFLAAALLVRFLAPRWRGAIYALAGGLAVLAAILIMRASFGITTIAGARTTVGLSVQGLMGAAGGYVFALLTRPARGSPGRERRFGKQEIDA